MTNLALFLWLLLWYNVVFLSFLFFPLFLAISLLFSTLIRATGFLFYLHTLFGWFKVDPSIRCPVRIITRIVTATKSEIKYDTSFKVSVLLHFGLIC